MTLMHNFSSTRRLPSALKGGMTRYVDAMFAFNNDVEGTERLGNLPISLRGELLAVIYRRILAECDLLTMTSRETALMLCQHIQPQVCLGKSILVEKYAIATHLFLLHRGALHITQGENEDARKKSMARPGPHIKGKASLRVRVCERMGAFVGIYDPYDFSARLPLEVMAVKLSQLFAIERHDLIDTLEAVGESEANIVLQALEAEKKLVLDALKINRPAVSVRGGGGGGTAAAGAEGGSGGGGGGAPGGGGGEPTGTTAGGTPEQQALAAALTAEGGGGETGGGGPSPAGSPLMQRRSSAGSDVSGASPGGGGTSPPKARRRTSVTVPRRGTLSGSVGTLLNDGGGAASAGAKSGDAVASATVALFDDAVLSMKTAARELEEQTFSYSKEVTGFVQGIAPIEDLVATLSRIPKGSRPKAPPLAGGGAAKGVRVDLGASLESFRNFLGAPTKDERGLSREELSKQLQEAVPLPKPIHLPSATGGGSVLSLSPGAASPNKQSGAAGGNEALDSGSRLLSNLAKMGADMWDGIRSNRNMPPEGGAGGDRAGSPPPGANGGGARPSGGSDDRSPSSAPVKKMTRFSHVVEGQEGGDAPTSAEVGVVSNGGRGADEKLSA